MNIELERKVSVTSYEAIMEIGIESERDDILAVLELGRNRNINPQMVNEELLFRPENSSHGMRIVEVLESYGLIMRSPSGNYELTEAGQNTLENRKVKIPEKGYYILHLTDDPLFRDCILRYDEMNKKSWQEFEETRSDFYDKNRDKNKKTNKQKTISKPDCLKKYTKGSMVKLAGKRNEEIQVNEIDETLFESDSKLDVYVKIHLDEQSTSVKVVSDKEKEIEIEHNFNLKPIDVFKELFGDIQEIKEELKLPVSYDNITDAERIGMIRRDIKKNNITINGYGMFRGISVDKISLMPKNKKDAKQWAKWHLLNSIKYYFDERDYLEKKRSASEKFVDFYDLSEIDSELPDFYEFIDEIAVTEPKTATYWYARAPIDLNNG